MKSDVSAASANRELYGGLHGAAQASAYINAAPHLKHRQLRKLFEALMSRVYSGAVRNSPLVRVLDIGAGEGTATHIFLRFGANVTAVDISEDQLNCLRAQCSNFEGRLEVHNEDAWDTVKRPGNYDIVLFNSFLHHVPDYLELMRLSFERIAPQGQFVSFQDPLRYDTLGKSTYMFSHGSYFAWRLFQGNLWDGFNTRIRRARGIYIEGSKQDDAEYHVTRNGLDQLAMSNLLQLNGFEPALIRYFSTQGAMLQKAGSFLGLQNTFAILGRRRN